MGVVDERRPPPDFRENITKSIKPGVESVMGNWKGLEAIAKELVRTRRLSYSDCVKIAEKADPGPPKVLVSDDDWDPC